MRASLWWQFLKGDHFPSNSTQCQSQNRQVCFLFSSVEWGWLFILSYTLDVAILNSSFEGVSRCPAFERCPAFISCSLYLTQLRKQKVKGFLSPSLHFGDPSFPCFHAHAVMCKKKCLLSSTLMVCDLVERVSENFPELAWVFNLFSFNPPYSMLYLSTGLLLFHSRLWGPEGPGGREVPWPQPWCGRRTMPPEKWVWNVE